MYEKLDSETMKCETIFAEMDVDWWVKPWIVGWIDYEIEFIDWLQSYIWFIAMKTVIV